MKKQANNLTTLRLNVGTFRISEQFSHVEKVDDIFVDMDEDYFVDDIWDILSSVKNLATKNT